MQLTGQCTLDRDKDLRYGIWTPDPETHCGGLAFLAWLAGRWDRAGF